MVRKIFNKIIPNSRELFRKKRISREFKKRIDKAIENYDRIRSIPKVKRFPAVREHMNSLIRSLKKVGKTLEGFKQSKPRRNQNIKNFRDLQTTTNKNEKKNFRKRHRSDIVNVFKGEEETTTIKFKNDNDRTQTIKLINKLFGSNQSINIVITVNGTHYTLNENNLELLKKVIIKGRNRVIATKGIRESDDEILSWLETANEIKLRGVNKAEVARLLREKRNRKTKEKDEAGFFKYTTKVHFKAWERYGLFNKVDSNNYKINCFIRAMREHNILTDKELQSLMKSVKNRYLAIKDVRKFADKLGLHIKVRVYRKHKSKDEIINNAYNLGDKNSKRRFNIACIDDHYFIEDHKTSVTKFALKNYDKVKGKKDWNLIRQIQDGKKRKKDKKVSKVYRKVPVKDREKHFTSSPVLVNFLLKNKDKFLEPIKMCKALQQTQFYDKTKVLDNLKYDDTDVKPIILTNEQMCKLAKQNVTKMMNEYEMNKKLLKELKTKLVNETKTDNKEPQISKEVKKFVDKYREDSIKQMFNQLPPTVIGTDEQFIREIKDIKIKNPITHYTRVEDEDIKILLYNFKEIKRAIKPKRRSKLQKRIDNLEAITRNRPSEDRIYNETFKYLQKGNERKINKKPKVDVSKLPKIYFDGETCKNTSRVHSLFLLCAEYRNTGRITKKSYRETKDFLESLTEPHLLIAHNLGYDFRFIMEHLFGIKLIEKNNGIMSGEACYKKADGTTIKLYFKDSLKMIPMALSKFPKCFGIKSHVNDKYMPFKLHKKCVAENVEWAKLTDARKELCQLDNPIRVYGTFIKRVKEWGLIRKKNKNEFNIIDYYDKCCYFQKEVMPYNMYTTRTVKLKRMQIASALKHFKTKGDKKQFIRNIKRWELYKGDNEHFDHIKYAKKYCELDCTILRRGYETFKKWMIEATGLNIDNFVSLPSLIHKYLIKEGCYDGVYELSGIVREFIQKCVVGGRCMTRDNKKWHVKKLLQDFDAVSLYPSAMVRLGGFLKGKPKVLPKGVTYDDIKGYDGYFVEVNIKDVKKHRHFPLLNKMNDDGIRDFSNDIRGSIYVDKIGLEDLIKFQDIDFEIVRGYYFNEGRNYTIKRVMTKLFNERLKKKAEIMPDGSKGNPAQVVYKLLMNSSYGKTIMKPIETENKFFTSKLEVDAYIIRHHNSIKYHREICGLEDKFIVKKIVNINNHFSLPHVGVEILSMSKRIMNEVMCLAEDKGIKIYYQDTDSMHIEAHKIEDLKREYKKEYDRDLEGKGMGQFHCDFDFKHDKGTLPVALESYFLGKKVYIDLVKAVSDGEEKIHHHIRMKGVPSNVIKSYGNVMDIYEDLYQGKKKEFNLMKIKDSFEFKNDYSIITKDKFKREVKFNLPKAEDDENII